MQTPQNVKSLHPNQLVAGHLGNIKGIAPKFSSFTLFDHHFVDGSLKNFVVSMKCF